MKPRLDTKTVTKETGARFSKALKIFGPINLFLDDLCLKTGRFIRLKLLV